MGKLFEGDHYLRQDTNEGKRVMVKIDISVGTSIEMTLWLMVVEILYSCEH